MLKLYQAINMKDEGMNNTGKISQIMGAVVDVTFKEGQIPKI